MESDWVEHTVVSWSYGQGKKKDNRRIEIG